MRNDHTPFDILAGAIALGEATQAERGRFGAHARGCTLCGEDGADGLGVLRDRIAAARDEETWRPALGSALMTRIRNERLHRARLILRVLSCAVAFSIAFDAAFVTGMTTYAEHAVGAAGASVVSVLGSYRTALR